MTPLSPCPLLLLPLPLPRAGRRLPASIRPARHEQPRNGRHVLKILSSPAGYNSSTFVPGYRCNSNTQPAHTPPTHPHPLVQSCTHGPAYACRYRLLGETEGVAQHATCILVQPIRRHSGQCQHTTVARHVPTARNPCATCRPTTASVSHVCWLALRAAHRPAHQHHRR